MKGKRIIMWLLAIAMMSSLMGCKSSGNTSVSGVTLDPDATYPLDTDEVLTIWGKSAPSSSKYSKTEELPYIQELQKETGVKLEYVYTAAGQKEERLKIMLAAGDATDIIEYDWAFYPGGPEKVLSEGHIIALNDLMDTYAKNFKRVVTQNPEADKIAKNNEGLYYTFPQIREDEKMNTAYGPIIRKDWLDELGLEMPETLDDWYNILTAFKEKKNATTPMIISFSDLEACGMFLGAYGVRPGFYRENDKVKYGPIEEGYKNALIYLNKMYKEGLFGENITNVTADERNGLMLNHKAGAAIGWLNSSIKNWQNNSAVADTSFNLSGTKYPTLKKGETPRFGYRGQAVIATNSISSASKKKELAAKFLDFRYTEKGEILANFGIEGESYVMKDSRPVYTDIILKNPEGLSVTQALSEYTDASSTGPFFYRLDAFMQINETERQRTALDFWSQTDAKTYNLPAISIPGDMTSEYSSIYADIQTYVENMFYKFVMGLEPIEKFDEYVEQIKKMNIDRAIEINQIALDNFNKR